MGNGRILPKHGITLEVFKRIIDHELESRIITVGTKKALREQVRKVMKETKKLPKINGMGVGIHGNLSNIGTGIAFGKEVKRSEIYSFMGLTEQQIKRHWNTGSDFFTAVCWANKNGKPEGLGFKFRGTGWRERNGVKQDVVFDYVDPKKKGIAFSPIRLHAD